MNLEWNITVNVSIMRGTGAAGSIDSYIGNETYTLKVNKLTDLRTLLDALQKMTLQGNI